VGGPAPYAWPEPTHDSPKRVRQPDLFGRSVEPWVSAGQALGISGVLHTGGEDYRERDDRKTRERPISTQEPCFTVGGRGNQMFRIDGGDCRRLTVEECAKLQGLPDTHRFTGNKTSRYTQVGNAVPPKMAEAVGRAILAADR